VTLQRSAAAALLAAGALSYLAAQTPAPPARPAAAAPGRPAAASARPLAEIDGAYFSEMRWRSIGPFRGGRSKAVVGVPSQPNVFYIGVNNGGVWKTTDAGRTWTPIFDDQPTGSIGDIAVSPSDPNIVYVASGEGLQRPDLSTGDGVYKSTDAGKTWTHLSALRDGQQLPRVIVDPKDPNRLFVAVLGHPYGPNAERGLYRSTDGGRTFEKVLSRDENTGASDVEFDPSNPSIVYAALWEARQGPWENAAWSGTSGGIFKSTDGGTTWRPLTRGLPEEGVVQADVAVAPANPSRLYASVASPRAVSIYRSDDGGENWTRATTDNRPAGRIGGGDLPVPTVDPANADIVYMASTVMWQSTDGGKTWTGFRGAPGGDDYQRVWINPTNPSIIATASDQGAVITVNGGASWSSWYNQPTAQLYHVAADNSFPYRLCSGQQESGSACVASRGDDGQVTVREWHPVGVEEYGYAAPDPLDPDLVYGGKITRFDRRTGQVTNIHPLPGRRTDYRAVRTQPVVFSPVDPHVLYFAANKIWKTANGGRSWQQISPDLTRKTWEIPPSVGKYRTAETAQPTQRGVIYAVGPSYLDVNRIWAGTDDGLIHVTSDGGLHWKDVTPPDLKPWAKVSIVDAGRFDVQTAYAAINTFRLDELRPHIYRTHDGGATWTHITTGIPDGATVNVVREDPKRKGLLFAGTEREVYVSFDDGDHWRSLRLNMAASSVRDLIVKDDDLAVATHGRGFWILDDITPLRQVDSSVLDADVFLFEPQTAVRTRWNKNTDTPWPPDEPAGLNPPDGAVINYALKAAASGPVVLEILDAAGNPVRRYASTDPADPPDPATAPVPLYWYRPPQRLSGQPGMHRFTWDLHYQPIAGVTGGRGGLPIAAVAHNTVPAPSTPWVAPGAYTVRLTVDGRSHTRPLTVRMDPRVKTPAAGLTQQFTLSKQLYDGIARVQATLPQIRELRALVKDVQSGAQGATAAALESFGRKAMSIEGEAVGGRGAGPGGGGRGGGTPDQDTLSTIAGSLTPLIGILQGADVTPTTQAVAAVNERLRALDALMAKWNALRTSDLAALNAQLKSAGLRGITVTGPR
jgi:photosystem II stability/assembly factor-like uncharacterized protein